MIFHTLGHLHTRAAQTHTHTHTHTLTLAASWLLSVASDTDCIRQAETTSEDGESLVPLHIFESVSLFVCLSSPFVFSYIARSLACSRPLSLCRSSVFLSVGGVATAGI